MTSSPTTTETTTPSQFGVVGKPLDTPGSLGESARNSVSTPNAGRGTFTIGQELNGYFSTAQEINPLAVNSIGLSPAASILAPEVFSLTAPQMESAQVSADVMDSIVATLSLESVATLESHLMQDEATGIFLRQYGNTLRTNDKALIVSTMVNLDEENRNQVSALAIEYLQHSPIRTEDDREKFLIYVYEQTQRKLNEQSADEGGFFTSVGNFVSKPFQAVSEFATDLWARSAGPQQYAHRQFLSIGQNITISSGIDPSESSFSTVSGTADFAANIFLDPVSWAGVAGQVGRAARTVPRLAEMGRVAAFLRPGASSGGKIPLLSRGLTGRFTWALMSRTTEEMVNTPRAARAFSRMAQIQNIGELVEAFPTLKPVADTVGRLIADSSDAHHIREVVRAALPGGGFNNLDETPLAAQMVKPLLDSAREEYRAARNAALEEGRIGVADLSDVFDDVTGEFFGYVDDTSGLGLLESVALEGEGREVVAVTRGMNRLKMEGDEITRAAVWMAGQSSQDARRAAAILGRRGGQTTLQGAELSATVLGAARPAAKLPIGSGLDEGVRRWIMRYAESRGAHLVEGADGALLTDRGRRAAHIGDDLPRAGEGVSEVLRSQVSNLVSHEDLARKAEQTNSRMWIISDMPRNRITTGSLLRGPMTTGDLDVSPKAWQSAFRRASSAFLPGAPRSINLRNAAEGAQELRAFMRRAGASEASINEMVDRFARAVSSDRIDVITEAIQRVGREAGHPLVEHGMVRFSEKGLVASFSSDLLGNEIGVALDSAGRPTSVPIRPSHLTNEYMLPGREFYQMLNRYQAGQALPALTRGILPKTRRARQTLADRYGRRLIGTTGHRGSALLSDSDRYAIAFADVMGPNRASALGAMSKVQDILGSGWSSITHAFSVAQLAFRPFSWSMRVLMEETVRANMMGLPSIWRRPTDFVRRIGQSWTADRLQTRLARLNRNLNRTVLERIPAGLTGDELIRAATDLIPDFATRAAADAVDLASAPAVRNYVLSALNREIRRSVGTPGSLGNIPRRILRNGRNLRRSTDALAARGLTEGFDFSVDAAGIMNRSFTSQFTRNIDASVPLVYDEAMSETQLQAFADGWAQQVSQIMSDSASRAAIQRKLAILRSGNPGEHTGGRFIRRNQAAWNDMRRRVVGMADYRGIKYDSVDELADWWLDDVLGAEVDALLRPFLEGRSTTEQINFLESFLKDRTINADFDGALHSVQFSDDAFDTFRDGMRELAADARVASAPMPPRVAPTFDPRFGQQKPDSRLRQFIDWNLNLFGERATQRLNRKPAWIQQFDLHNSHYQRLGVNPETASLLAAERATERVNYVFFNQRDVPRFFQAMNDVSPFFSAMFEVTRTWAWRLPREFGTLQGHAVMARKVDRVMDGLVSAGLVTPGDPDPETGERQMFLNLDDSTPVGRAALMAAKTPINLLSHLGFIRNLMGEDFDGDLLGDRWQVAIGSPVNPFSHGVMATTQLSLGVNPVLLPAVSRIRNRLPFAVDERLIDIEAGQSLEELAEQEGVDLGALMQANIGVIEQQLGKELAGRLFDGTLDPADVQFPEGTFRLPGTNLVGQLIDTAIFPFGKQESPAGVLYDFAPSWATYALRGLGLYAGDEDNPAGMLPGMWDNQSRAQLSSEIITQLQHLEASEGLLTRATQLGTEIQSLIQAVRSELGDESATIEALDPHSEVAQRYWDLQDELTALNAQIVKRSTDNAAGSLLLRGLFGFLLPSTPRFQSDEQLALNEFYTSRDWAEAARARGSDAWADSLPEARSIEDLDRAAALVGAWYADESGDLSKAFLRENYPELLPFIQGKSFWGDIGMPPEIDSIDEYYEQIKSGQREVYSAGVWAQRHQRAMVSLDTEIALINAFGNDSEEAAANALSNWGLHQEIKEEGKLRYEALDWEDDLLNGGEYLRWQKERGRGDDEMTFYQALTADVELAMQTVDEILASSDILEMTGEEARDFTSTLNRISQEIGELFREYTSSIPEERMNPRERIIADYFEQVASPYYEGLSALYEQAANAPNNQERAFVFEQIREYKNEHYLGPRFATSSGTQFPNEQERHWGGLDEDERNRRLDKALAQPTEWHDLFTLDRLVERSPSLDQYLPTGAADMSIYQQATEAKNTIKLAGRQLDADGNPLMTPYEMSQLTREVDDSLRRQLREEGRAGEAWYLDAWPIQRLAVADVLPEVLRPDLEMVNSIRNYLDALDGGDGKGPKSNEGRAAFLNLEQIVLNNMANDPRIYQAYLELGDRMFGETIASVVFARLWFGDNFGSLG